MTQANELTAPPVRTQEQASGSLGWLFSWPLLAGMAAYLFCFYLGKRLLQDGDTLWHVAAGQWILQNGFVPAYDPFSHTVRGAAWTAQEWLSEVILAGAHDLGGWTGVMALTALAFAATIALLTRTLLRSLEPVYAVLFAVFAIAMTASHLLARPHILAMPLMMIWTIGLVRAVDSGRAPSLWLLPVMTVWANMHAGFTLGLLIAFAISLEPLLSAWKERRLAGVVRSWGIFLALAVASALVTPHGPQGILYTWQVFTQSTYALDVIGEWRSPNFHLLQPLELWILGGLAVVLHQGLRFPPIRILFLLGFLHLALKYVRNVELLGLLVPLFLATPLAAQWRLARKQNEQAEGIDRFFLKLAQPSGKGALLVGLCIFIALPLWSSRARPIAPPDSTAPTLAVRAVRDAGIKGPVLNGYSWGGYLIYEGIAPFIDGRAEVYGDTFFKAYADATTLKTSEGLQKLVDKHRIEWTLFPPDHPSVALLDHLPGWRRLYTDKNAVVQVRTAQR